MSLEFQFHITVSDFSLDRKPDFIKLCESLGVWPLVIELPKGDYTKQPMYTQIVSADSLDDARLAAAKNIEIFRENGFEIAREKAEARPEDTAHFTRFAKGFTPYYEWHCKVIAEPFDFVKKLVTENNGHLSENSLDDDRRQRYITVRVYGDRKEFSSQVNRMRVLLAKNAIPIVRQVSEYCVFDSRLALDGGWAEKSQKAPSVKASVNSKDNSSSERDGRS